MSFSLVRWVRALRKKHAPRSVPYAEKLQAYQALAGRLPAEAATPADATVDPPRHSEDDGANDWPQRLDTLEWYSLANRLTRDGYAVIAGRSPPRPGRAGGRRGPCRRSR